MSPPDAPPQAVQRVLAVMDRVLDRRENEITQGVQEEQEPEDKST